MENKPKFTGGPWIHDRPGDIIRSENGIGALVAYVNYEDSHHEKGQPDANAALISAAPEMYEALGAIADLADMVDATRTEKKIARMARAAIKKAKGE